MLTKTIPAALKNGQFWSAMTALRTLPAAQYYADACRFLSQIEPGMDRDRVRAALDDLLTHRPHRVWLMPVVIEIGDRKDAAYQIPSIDARDIPAGVTEMKWLGIQTAGGKFQQEPVIVSDVPTCVLLLICTPDDDEPPELSDEWFSDLFHQYDYVRLSQGPALSFAVGLEAGLLGRAILSSSDAAEAHTPNYFLPDADWAGMVNMCLDFQSSRASCAQDFSASAQSDGH